MSSLQIRDPFEKSRDNRDWLSDPLMPNDVQNMVDRALQQMDTPFGNMNQMNRLMNLNNMNMDLQPLQEMQNQIANIGNIGNLGNDRALGGILHTGM